MPADHPSTTPPSTPSRAVVTRAFGRFALQRLLGKSSGSSTWLAFDPQRDHDVVLMLPRVQPADAAALELWMRDVAQAARLKHPNLTPVLDTGVQDHWPYIVLDRRLGVTLPEWLAEHPQPAPAESAGWWCDVLQGLAFAHEAGAAHLDLQLHHLIINERGAVSVMGLAVALTGDAPFVQAVAGAGASAGAEVKAQEPNPSHTNPLHTQRALAERDVLACGVLLHQLLAGKPALGEADTALVIARMARATPDVVRLPRVTPVPVPEALRAIANRCTSEQERIRYRSARTLLGALSGWREGSVREDGGPVALLLERLRTNGHLPALPGLARRVSSLTMAEGQRTDAMAEQVLHDMALSLELLRTLNSAQVQGTQIPGNGPVLTLRRAIALVGTNGVRRAASNLRAWPGPLGSAPATVLEGVMNRVHLAAHVAQALRPAGYDPEVVYLITVLQNLGRLMLRYHFAEEAEQVQQLMQPAPALPPTVPVAPRAAELPGLSEQAAAFAVLGVDVDTLALAVARQWGLADELLHMIRRLPTDAPVRKPDTDAEMLRLTASAANEVVDATGLSPPPRAVAAMANVAQRYGRVLGVNAKDIQEALRSSRDAMGKTSSPPAPGGTLRSRAKASA